MHMYVHVYTGCPRRNVKYLGRVFFMLNYTDITQNIYIQSWTVTEIMAREKCGHLAFPRSIRLQLYREPHLPVVLWLLAERTLASLRRTSPAQRDKTTSLLLDMQVLGTLRQPRVLVREICSSV